MSRVHKVHRPFLAGLIVMLGATTIWAAPPNPTASDVGNNTAGGSDAVSQTTPDFGTGDGFGNTGFGFSALKANTTGGHNTALGESTLRNNVSGDYNTAAGSSALGENTTGSSNSAFGDSALGNNTSGLGNTAVGGQALLLNSIGSNNTAVGMAALLKNTGDSNTAIGSAALPNNTTGGDNTAVGNAALEQSDTGSCNTAVGSRVLQNSTSGRNNAALGCGALGANLTGKTNSAFGVNALAKSTDGSENIAVGSKAGSKLTTGKKNIYIGNVGEDSESRTMRLGQTQTRTFIAGIAGAHVGGSAVLIDANGQLGIVASSARYKREIRGMGEQSRRLLQLRPVTFRYRRDPDGQRQYGLIAEEVAKVYPELVVRGTNGRVESIQYHELIPMLLNEVQHQKRELDARTEEIASLREANAGLRAAFERAQARAEDQESWNVAVAARLADLESGSVRTAALASR